MISDELAVADAHPLGARPFAREQYINKFAELAEDVVEPAEQQRFLSAVDALADYGPALWARSMCGSIRGCWTRRRSSRRGSSDDGAGGRRGVPAPPTSAQRCARLWILAGCNAFRARSRRWWPKPSRTPASRGFTCPAPHCRPTSDCRTSGLTTLTEVATRGAQIAGATDLPTLIDADTGFGEPTQRRADRRRCSRTPGWPDVTWRTRSTRSGAGTSTARPSYRPTTWSSGCARPYPRRRDPNFVICARTDAAGIEGLDAAIERASAYVDAGADMIFPEALDRSGRVRAVPRRDRRSATGEHDRVRQVAAAYRATQLSDIGYNVVIYPVTTLRLAMFAVEAGLREIARSRNSVRSLRANAAPQPAVLAAALRGLQRIRHRYLTISR